MTKVTPPSHQGDDELRKRLEDNPPKPLILKDGDIVVGDFVKYDKGMSFDYGEFHTAILANVDVSGMKEPPAMESGDFGSLALFHEALKSRFDRLRPKREDRLAAKRIGMATSQRSGRNFVNWTLASAAEDTGVSEEDVFGPRKPRAGQPEQTTTGEFDDPFPF